MGVWTNGGNEGQKKTNKNKKKKFSATLVNRSRDSQLCQASSPMPPHAARGHAPRYEGYHRC